MLNFEEDILTEEISAAQPSLQAVPPGHPAPQPVSAANEPTVSGRVQAVEEDIYSFASRRRRAVLPVILLELTFHALGVLETHLAMWMILGHLPPLLDSFIIETANRLITVAFKFIPFQLGVGEVGAAMVTTVLRLGPEPGGILSIVRKARMGTWALAGGALLMRRR